MDSSATRPPAVAGLFYPGDVGALRAEIAQLLPDADAPQDSLPAQAVIAPHAGYRYSGPVAASAFRALEGQRQRRVILLGPSHFVRFRGLALPAAGAYATPLGEVPLDSELVARAAEMACVGVSEAAHEREHSLEVELPFLQTVLGEITLLPLLVGEASVSEVAEVLEQVWNPEESLLVVSSDLSHYLPYDEARRADEETARRILDLEAPLEAWRACGARVIDGLLEVAAGRALSARLLDLRNSGDTAGDPTRVVGYGAFAFGAG